MTIMLYCPNCRDQFEDWVKKCPDCQIKLVDRLPETKKENAPLVNLTTAPNEGIAVMWSDILKDNGVRSLIKNAAMNIYVQTYGSPYELYVLEPDIEKAKKILEPFLEQGQ